MELGSDIEIELQSQQTTNEVQFVQGSMVWAQYPGWPWWPAMIRGESKDGLSSFISGGEIHVQFFHNPPTRAWVSTSSLKPYRGRKDVDAPPISSRDKYFEEWVISCDFADAEPFNCSTSEERLEKYLIVFEDETYDDWLKTFNATAEKMGLGRPDHSTPPIMESSNECEKVVYKNPGRTPISEVKCANIAKYTYVEKNTMSRLILEVQKEQIRRKHYLQNGQALPCVCREVGGRKCTLMSRCPNVKARIACPATCGSACRNNPWAHNQFVVGKKTYIQSTTWKGLGLHASFLIKKHQFLGEYTGNIIVGWERTNEHLAWYSYSFEAQPQRTAPSGLWIDAFRQGSALRLVNHSCKPNCETMHYVHDNLYKVVFKTTRDIQPGEEITIDYHWVYPSLPDAIECFCEVRKKCSGIIGIIKRSFDVPQMAMKRTSSSIKGPAKRNKGNKAQLKKSIPNVKRDVYNGVPNRLVVTTLSQSESQSPSFSGSNEINQGQDPPAASAPKRRNKEEDSESGNKPPSKKPSPGVTRLELEGEAISAEENSVIVTGVPPPEPIIIDLSEEESDEDPKCVVTSTLPKPSSISGNSGNGVTTGQGPAAASSSQSSIQENTSSVTFNEVSSPSNGVNVGCSDELTVSSSSSKRSIQEDASAPGNVACAEPSGQERVAMQPNVDDGRNNTGADGLKNPQLSYLQQQNPTLQERCEEVNKKLEQQLQDQNDAFQNNYLQPNVTPAEQIEAWQTHRQIQTLLFKQHIQTHNYIIQRHHNS